MRFTPGCSGFFGVRAGMVARKIYDTHVSHPLGARDTFRSGKVFQAPPGALDFVEDDHFKTIEATSSYLSRILPIDARRPASRTP
jgi:hypothetical protein